MTRFDLSKTKRARYKIFSYKKPHTRIFVWGRNKWKSGNVEKIELRANYLLDPRPLPFFLWPPPKMKLECVKQRLFPRISIQALYPAY